MKNLDQIIGENLRFLRTQFGFSQENISRFLNISQPAYLKYEKGETTVNKEALEALANMYNVDEYDLMQENQDGLRPCLVYAFRQQGDETDLASLAKFHKIVKNYISMCNELD